MDFNYETFRKNLIADLKGKITEKEVTNEYDVDDFISQTVIGICTNNKIFCFKVLENLDINDYTEAIDNGATDIYEIAQYFLVNKIESEQEIQDIIYSIM